VTAEMLETSFHIHGDEETRMLIGCPLMAERQNRNGSYGAMAGGKGNSIFYVILTALTEFT